VVSCADDMREELERMEHCMNDADDKKSCVESVMKEFEYEGAGGREAKEEEEKVSN
jgi:hypothetical protein